MYLHMRKPPTVLGAEPTEIQRIDDRITIMKDPTLANNFIWRFEDGRDGINIMIHAELKGKSTYEWTEDETWQWFVNIATSEENLHNEKYDKSIATRSFREAVIYANEFAKSIQDIDLKPYIKA